MLNPKVSSDRRSVKLSIAANRRDDGKPTILSDTVRLRAGETFLLDGGMRGGMRDLILITPRVILVEEEEQVLFSKR